MRKEIKISQTLLTKVIRDLEVNGPLPNQSLLFEKAAENYNAVKEKDYPDISKALVYLRVKAWGIEIQTKAGKRGRQKLTPEDIAHMQQNRKTRGKRSSKFNKNACAALETHFKQEAPRFLPIVNKCNNGSLKAAVKLMCIECGGWEPSEVKQCNITSCPLWNFRPGAGKKVNEVVEEDQKVA